MDSKIYYTKPQVLFPILVISISSLIALIIVILEICRYRGWIRERPYPIGVLRRRARARAKEQARAREMRRVSRRTQRGNERALIGGYGMVREGGLTGDGDVLPRYEEREWVRVVRVPPPVYDWSQPKFFGGA